MITPGPVVITVAFIGHLVGGALGATLAALGVFLPCYLLVVIPAPYFRRFANNPRLKAFVDGVTARRQQARSQEPHSCWADGPSSISRLLSSQSRRWLSFSRSNGFPSHS